MGRGRGIEEEEGEPSSAESQFDQQAFRLLQVAARKAFAKPAIDVCQEPVRLGVLPLGLPQAGEAHRRPQFESFRTLLASQPNGLLKRSFDFVRRMGQREEEFAIEPVEFCAPELVIGLFS